MKQAILILGAESSGTRALTKIFVESGFYGDSTHFQRLDLEIPDTFKIVWRRSVPHGTHDDENRFEPDFIEMCQKLKESNYEIYAIVIHRDYNATVNSQIRNRHVDTEEEAYLHIQAAYKYIYNCLSQLGIQYGIVTYESLILHQKKTLEVFENILKTKLQTIDFTNENLKYQ